MNRPRACPAEADWAHEIKLDGYLQLRVEVARAALPDCVIDSEAVARNRDGVSDFSALQAALAEGRAPCDTAHAGPILAEYLAGVGEGRPE